MEAEIISEGQLFFNDGICILNSSKLQGRKRDWTQNAMSWKEMTYTSWQSTIYDIKGNFRQWDKVKKDQQTNKHKT